MKAKLKITKEVDVRYLKVDAGVRYWVDGWVNGKRDVDFMQTGGVGSPAMPFAVKVKGEPNSTIYSDHYRWQPLIDVEECRIVDWPKGTTAFVHYKVCDDGIYSLLDVEMKEIVKVESYVPDCLCLADNGYGDYIIMEIDEDGYIEDFSFTQDDVEEIIKNDLYYQED